MSLGSNLVAGFNAQNVLMALVEAGAFKLIDKATDLSTVEIIASRHIAEVLDYGERMASYSATRKAADDKARDVGITELDAAQRCNAVAKWYEVSNVTLDAKGLARFPSVVVSNVGTLRPLSSETERAEVLQREASRIVKTSAKKTAETSDTLNLNAYVKA